MPLRTSSTLHAAPPAAGRCSFVTLGERCILPGRELDDRILCGAHRDVVLDERVNRERRMTRRASTARMFSAR